MIVNLTLNESTQKLIFPKIQLNDEKKWEIAFVSFTGILQSGLETDGIYRLYTNMINRDQFNQQQDIIFTALKRGATYMEIQPTQSIKYKLRFHDFTTAVVAFYKIDSTQKLQFKSAALQLEITETYGRF